MLQTTLIYGITFLVSLIFCKVYEKKEKNLSLAKKIVFNIFILIPPILLATLRYNVGIDYFAYVHNYTDIANRFSLKLVLGYYSREPLYVLTTYLGKLLCGNFTGAFWIYSIIYIFFIFEGLKYYKNKISITLGLFIFYMTYYLVFFNMIRQMIAVSIIFFASRYIFEKKFLKYVFFVIIAGLFHKTAYIMVFLYFIGFNIDSLKINKLYYLTIILLPIIMLPLFKLILIANQYLGIFTKYSNINLNFNIKFLLYVVPTLLFVWYYRKGLLKKDKNNEILIRILFLQLPAQFAGCFVEYADRFAVYFGIFQAVLIPMILDIEFKKNIYTKECKNNIIYKLLNFSIKILNDRKYRRIIIISWYLFYYIVLYIIMNSNGVYPYRSVFEMKNVLEYKM